MVKTHRYLAAAAFASGLLFSTSACASPYYQYGGNRPIAQSNNYRELDRWAYNNGLAEGQRNGERDARKGARYRVDNDKSYQRADTGFYRRGNYPLYQYQTMFRQGYEAGYNESYNRYARVNDRVRPGVAYPPYSTNYPPYPQTYPPYSNGGGYYSSAASTNGYNDGLNAGRDDARSNKSFDPRRPKLYRDGDHNYSSRDGSRDQYKQDYRVAFQQGYEQGYREYRR